VINSRRSRGSGGQSLNIPTIRQPEKTTTQLIIIKILYRGERKGLEDRGGIKGGKKLGKRRRGGEGFFLDLKSKRGGGLP